MRQFISSCLIPCVNFLRYTGRSTRIFQETVGRRVFYPGFLIITDRASGNSSPNGSSPWSGKDMSPGSIHFSRQLKIYSGARAAGYDADAATRAIPLRQMGISVPVRL